MTFIPILHDFYLGKEKKDCKIIQTYISKDESLITFEQKKRKKQKFHWCVGVKPRVKIKSRQESENFPWNFSETQALW